MSYQQYRVSSFKLLPDIVKNLMIINAIAFVADQVLTDKLGYSLSEHLGLYYPGSPRFAIYQIITHLFMHGSFWHLFSNMLALWMFGNVLENIWGGKRFLIFYFVCGIGAALILMLEQYLSLHSFISHENAFLNDATPEALVLFVKRYIPLEILTSDYNNAVTSLQTLWSEDPGNHAYIMQAQNLIDQFAQFKMNIPTVGASGAIFGVLLAFGMLFPNTIIYLYFAIPIKAKYFVILYGLFELYSGVSNNPTDNVAHFAHLGGMLFGFILIKYWGKTKRQNFF